MSISGIGPISNYDSHKLAGSPEDVEAVRKAERRQAIIAAFDKAVRSVSEILTVDCTCHGYSLVVEVAIGEEDDLEAQLAYTANDLNSVVRCLRNAEREVAVDKAYEAGRKLEPRKAVTR